MKGSSWDTVLILTISQELVTDVFSSISDARKVLYTPMYRCVSKGLIVKCSRCIVKTLSTRKNLDNELLHRIDKHTLSKYIERINVSYLPLEISKPYVIVEFGNEN